ncbi:hypothetical protein E1286_00200 [Nonomuraea terrae]|uniref:Uncharacterized protein n=1 Tax=Nonomuraea terrae TaxID=2530383 RepID=A0A4R4ZFM4_9ACTN|nr:hypothetical protein [Nonomuraea terrae]TDD57185.1 hypothetical protein E1286_00200 [Nonomuraea terrae]
MEISFRSEAGHLSLHEWRGGDVHELPTLPAGPGWFRLRYHAQNMDEAAEVDTSDEIINRHLLQIWPQEESTPRTLAARWPVPGAGRSPTSRSSAGGEATPRTLANSAVVQ